MKSIDELIAEFCPDGVEYKPLRELGDFYGGLTGKCKDDFGNGNAKFISYMNVYSNPATNLEVSDMVRIGQNEKQNQIQYGDVLFTGSSETPEECAMSSVVTTDITEPIYLNSFCFGFRLFDKSLYHPGFLKHLLRGEATRKQLHKTASGVTRFNVSKQRMASVIIPRPCIEIQREIVRFLDGFTGLIDELEAELAARRKQYKQYIDRVLDSGVTDIYCSLSEVILSLNTGLNPRQFFKLNTKDAVNYYVTIREIHDGKIVFSDKTDRINDTALSLCNNRSNLEVGDVLFSGTGTIGETAVIEAPPTNWNIKEGVYAVKPDPSKVLPRYLHYAFMCSSVRKAYGARIFGGTVKSISMKDLRKIKIPVPSLPEQKRIVEILDRFDALCNDETAGLAAEIAARKKQYEYYRDKLLTFKRKAS